MVSLNGFVVLAAFAACRVHAVLVRGFASGTDSFYSVARFSFMPDGESSTAAASFAVTAPLHSRLRLAVFRMELATWRKMRYSRGLTCAQQLSLAHHIVAIG